LGLTLSDNVLYVSGGWPLDTSGIDPSRHQTAIVALNPATGAIHWIKQPEFDIQHPNLDATLFRASPLVVGNSIFIATKLRAKNGRDVDILFALNKQDGTVKWTFEMWGYDSPFSDFDGVPSAPIVSDNLLYIISGNEMLYAVSYAD
jgi:outer membrane protein assembly factor BamB